MNETGISVTDLNLMITETVRSNPRFKSVTVRGEVSSFRNQMTSGHWYFSLKDEQAAIPCAMWRTNTLKAKIRPKDGDQVLADGYVDFYAPQGKIQLIVTDLRSAGLGDLYVRLEELKRRLAAEGLFDPGRKKPTPLRPSKVAVVTSRSGAALQDILNVSRLRCPSVPIVLVPVPVQGTGAGKEIAEGIIKADRETDADVIIVARGGGSAEDLWCFNDEAVVRAVADCRKPVVSGVGHEIDTTLCDLAADLRASTPSNAAELVFPDRRELVQRLNLFRAELVRAGMNGLQKADIQLREAGRRLAALSPEKRITLLMNSRELIRDRLCSAMADRLNGNRTALNDARRSLSLSVTERMRETEHLAARLKERLTAVNPMAVLNRGYAMVYDGEERLLTCAAEAGKRDRMTLQFADGRVSVTRKEGT